MGKFDKDTVLQEVLKIIKDLPSDWEKEFSNIIGKETRLFADLALESIQIVQLAVSIERHFQKQGLPFQKLFLSSDREIVNLRISDLVEFLYIHLNE